MTKEEELLAFLHEHVFDPILNSPDASRPLKSGVRLTITRMQQRDTAGMVQYYWSAIIGTERSTSFARQMREEASLGSRRSSTSFGIALVTSGCGVNVVFTYGV